MAKRKTQNLSLTKDETDNLDALAAMRGGTKTGQIRLMLHKEICGLSEAEASRFETALRNITQERKQENQ